MVAAYFEDTERARGAISVAQSSRSIECVLHHRSSETAESRRITPDDIAAQIDMAPYAFEGISVGMIERGGKEGWQSLAPMFDSRHTEGVLTVEVLKNTPFVTPAVEHNSYTEVAAKPLARMTSRATCKSEGTHRRA